MSGGEQARVRPGLAAIGLRCPGTAHLPWISSQNALWAADAQEAEVPGKGTALLPPAMEVPSFLLTDSASGGAHQLEGPLIVTLVPETHSIPSSGPGVPPPGPHLHALPQAPCPGEGWWRAVPPPGHTWVCLRAPSCTSSNGQKPQGAGVTAQTLQMKTLKFRECKPPAQRHTVSQQWDKDVGSRDCAFNRHDPRSPRDPPAGWSYNFPPTYVWPSDSVE